MSDLAFEDSPCFDDDAAALVVQHLKEETKESGGPLVAMHLDGLEFNGELEFEALDLDSFGDAAALRRQYDELHASVSKQLGKKVFDEDGAAPPSAWRGAPPSAWRGAPAPAQQQAFELLGAAQVKVVQRDIRQLGIWKY